MLLEQDTERTSSSSAVTASTHTCQGDQSHVRRARRPTPWPQANLLSLGAATCADPAVSGTPALLSPEPRPTKDKSSILRVSHSARADSELPSNEICTSARP